MQEKIETFREFPAFAGFLFHEVEPDPALLDRRILEEAERSLAEVEPFTTEAIEQALRALAERLDLKPREAFQPIRVAVTGSKVSPGLFESIELLGKERRSSASVPLDPERLRGRERVERALELHPGPPPEGRRRLREPPQELTWHGSLGAPGGRPLVHHLRLVNGVVP